MVLASHKPCHAVDPHPMFRRREVEDWQSSTLPSFSFFLFWTRSKVWVIWATSHTSGKVLVSFLIGDLWSRQTSTFAAHGNALCDTFQCSARCFEMRMQCTVVLQCHIFTPHCYGAVYCNVCCSALRVCITGCIEAISIALQCIAMQYFGAVISIAFGTILHYNNTILHHTNTILQYCNTVLWWVVAV